MAGPARAARPQLAVVVRSVYAPEAQGVRVPYGAAILASERERRAGELHSSSPPLSAPADAA
jgi:hypothetical protein